MLVQSQALMSSGTQQPQCRRDMARTTMRRLGIAIAGIILLVPAIAGAQESDVARIVGQRLREGDRVTLVSDSGLTRGKLDAIGTAELVVRTASGVERVPFATITEARRKRTGILLGLVIGAGIGGACGAALASLQENEGGNATAAFVTLTASGAAIGAGIDALVNFERTVYRRDSAKHVSVTPVLSPAAAGIRASLRW
jgi:hypothetical protein